jgi:uncharacterized membrane protein YedE/YeeE
MSNFTPVPALLGGILIGLATSLFWFTLGRRAGVSGLWAGLFQPRARDRGVRLGFIAGLITVGAVSAALAPPLLGTAAASLPRAVVAGVLVGYGTQLGGGCTSGHGICGTARLELRAVVATVTFMLAGALAVLAARAWT